MENFFPRKVFFLTWPGLSLPFWAPVPWLLEASLVFQVVLHKYFEPSIIAVAFERNP